MVLSFYFNSRADAPIMGHVWEHTLAEDVLSLGYKSDGHCIGIPEFDPPSASKLRWELPDECIQVIEKSNKVAQALLNDVDLRLYVHDGYGKGLMKKFRVSPDAYIQMALQLAYYRDAGKFNLTYEASMTRLFKEGGNPVWDPELKLSCINKLQMQGP
ncbi:carnitine O-palmitoyltransferase 1, liver isoform-like isoform X3 [Artemia franciscana]|uniref:carnitine O-palmitoyltransferase 1, liver isoform-like isoform X3 n=1 Tax=Artemia franciscana TaxID=6661 RepID=UPI0032DA65B1